MAKYKCKQLGACDKADAGEIFNISAGADQKCPGCGVLLTPIADIRGTSSGGSKNNLIAAMVVVVALLAGGGYYFSTGDNFPKNQLSAEVVVTPAPAPAPATVDSQQTGGRGISPTEEEIKVQKKESESKLVFADAASAEQASNKAAANEIIKLAIAKMAQGKFSEAEIDLLSARERDPKQPLVSYNLAVLRLKQNRKDDAFKEFEASFMAGFSYFDKMDQDIDLEVMRKDPQFSALVARYRNKPAAQ